MTHSQPWIGVDLDGTLAHYESEQFPMIGDPIEPMVERVRAWLSIGLTVKIVTARVGPRVTDAEMKIEVDRIEKWCLKHLDQRLPVVCSKDYAMVELWDDRAVQVEHNTGRIAAPQQTRIRSVS
jgi:hypothetical protein